MSVELRGLPEGAHVRLDGTPVAGTVIRGTPGSVSVLTVEAPSYEPLRMELTFAAGHDIDIAGRLHAIRDDR